MELGDDRVAAQTPAQDQVLRIGLGIGEIPFLLARG